PPPPPPTPLPYTTLFRSVTCNPSGRDIASFVAEAKKQIEAQVKFPAGVYPVLSGAAEEQAEARSELLVHSLIAAAGILLLLAIRSEEHTSELQSLRHLVC